MNRQHSSKQRLHTHLSFSHHSFQCISSNRYISLHSLPTTMPKKFYDICLCFSSNSQITTTTVLRPFFQDHPGEPVPDDNFWTLLCKRRLTEVDTPTIWLGVTSSGLTSAHLYHPLFFTGRMPFQPPYQQCQSTEGN